MSNIHNSKRVAGLALTAILALGAFAGCGNNASGENPSSLGTASATASTGGATDLSGTWTLNKELSDLPRRPDSAHWAGRGDRHERPDSARWARFHERRHRDGHGPRPDSLRGDHHRRDRNGVPRTFTITQTDSTVEIAGPRGRSHSLFTDGRVMTPKNEHAPDGIETRASWSSEGHLVVEHKGPKGGTRTETFSLSADGRQLTVATHLDPAGDREARDFRRVYDAAVSGN